MNLNRLPGSRKPRGIIPGTSRELSRKIQSRYLPPAASAAVPIVPGGRLTTLSGIAVMTSTSAAKTTLYYTTAVHRYLPLFNGSIIQGVDFVAELSQTLADTTKSPAAALAETCYDIFGWDDSGTIRATRGYPWTYSATITMTIASPCVVTWNGHGLREGAPFIPTTTGALPTGLTAGTTYYIGRSPGANTFNLATTPANAAAGTFINTSGSQSGTHTGTNRDTFRGTGSGTTELDLTTALGMPTNKYSITNGPAANRGTFLGTIRTNASAQIDWLLPTTPAAGGNPAVLGVWNMYNRRMVAATALESDNSWTTSSTTWERFNSSLGNSISFVRGLEEDALSAMGFGFCTQSNVQYGAVAVGLNATNSQWSGRNLHHPAVTGASVSNGIYTSAKGYAPIGYSYLQLLQLMAGAGSVTFYGDNSAPNAQQSGIQLDMLM
jgi:hypothetical protein